MEKNETQQKPISTHSRMKREKTRTPKYPCTLRSILGRQANNNSQQALTEKKGFPLRIDRTDYSELSLFFLLLSL